MLVRLVRNELQIPMLKQKTETLQIIRIPNKIQVTLRDREKVILMLSLHQLKAIIPKPSNIRSPAFTKEGPTTFMNAVISNKGFIVVDE